DGEIRKLEFEGFDEGVWVHKRKDLYYFTYPTAIKRDGKVKQLLVHSTSKTPYVPFTNHGPFFDNDPRNSHHSIIEIEGRWYLFYHVEGPSPYERRVCVEYLEYNEDGTIKEVKMSKTGVSPIAIKR
ncbi:MAG: family 43 glycosylhydrolase, partial [Ekhidna sp.]|nr:family 43 glycosylhydrolase [Ekhidna sp.]